MDVMRKIKRTIVISSTIGILLSTYAFYVEMAAEAEPEYKALCDIGEWASCTRVLSSEYSRGFGVIPKKIEIPNCIVGVLFYCTMIILETFDNAFVYYFQSLLSIGSTLISFYLGYLLMFVLHDFCIVCVSTYIVNIVIAICIYKKINLSQALSLKNK